MHGTNTITQEGAMVFDVHMYHDIFPSRFPVGANAAKLLSHSLESRVSKRTTHAIPKTLHPSSREGYYYQKSGLFQF